MKASPSLPALSSLEEDDDSSNTSQPSSFGDANSSHNDVSTEVTHNGPDIVEPHTEHKTVLVTGGAGFIGSHVAKFLLERGDKVVIVDELNDYYDVKIKQGNLDLLRALCPDEKRLRICIGDVCDEDLMASLFEEERPSWVCHMVGSRWT
jgi:UDP-glucuronate 4-epimerase